MGLVLHHMRAHTHTCPHTHTHTHTHTHAKMQTSDMQCSFIVAIDIYSFYRYNCKSWLTCPHPARMRSSSLKREGLVRILCSLVAPCHLLAFASLALPATVLCTVYLPAPENSLCPPPAPPGFPAFAVSYRSSLLFSSAPWRPNKVSLPPAGRARLSTASIASGATARQAASARPISTEAVPPLVPLRDRVRRSQTMELPSS